MKSPKPDQIRLLDLQALDTKLAQVDHKLANLPERQAHAELVHEREGLEIEVLKVSAAADDAKRELTRAETDVQLVRDRAARTQERLDSGQGPAKELQAMQHELESLARRQGVLEDAELEAMERAEGLSADAERARARLADLDERLGGATTALESAMGELERQRAGLAAERSDLAPKLPEDLVALYEKIRAQSGGLGAAALDGRRCGGCRLELDPSELSKIKAAAEDEVVRCEDCRRIVVRTGEGAR